MLKVHQIPALWDNYIYLIQAFQTNEVIIVDPSEAEPVFDFLVKNQLTPKAIFNTHHHPDHVGGNEALVDRYNIPVYCSVYDQKRIPGATNPLTDQAKLALLGLEFEVFEIPGHTLGHIAFYGHGALFCGDTLFAGGCGRLFEGDAAMLWDSLQKLRGLHDQTLVYCAHEYTQKNLEFALTIEPKNQALLQKYQAVKNMRLRDQPTVPTFLVDEKSYNPFLRADQQGAMSSLKVDTSDPYQVFAHLRSLKDNF